jgi:lysozyme
MEKVNAADIAVPRLELEEGFRAKIYWDAGIPTVGYGCNLDAGLTKHAAQALLTAQVDELHVNLSELEWYSVLDPVRQSVCIDVAFNVGLNGLLEFKNMIAALEAGKWKQAQAALLDSAAARELPTRYQALGLLLLNG